MPAINDFVIEIEGLSKTYKDVEALKSLDLTVPKNSIFGFLGPNGAGKTTTIKLLLGLARPTNGRATVFGQDSARCSLAIRKRIGYLPQEPRYYDYMTARETLRFAIRFYFDGPKAKLEKRVSETLALVGLSEKADRPVKGFSGGEKQRLGIAQAQVHQPDLLILDEPAANLDPMGRRNVLMVMERLRELATVFYSTHILGDVQRVSDTVAILNDGDLVAHAPIAELLDGTEDMVYAVSLRGDVDGAYQRVSSQPWVSKIQAISTNGRLQWQVHVTDADMAEAQLLSLVMADGRVTVAEYGRKKYDLEEVFVNLVTGGAHDSV
jgi:ABC-2 type transport system ATP-binding protein